MKKKLCPYLSYATLVTYLALHYAKRGTYCFYFQGKPLMKKSIFMYFKQNFLFSLVKVPLHCAAICLGVMTRLAWTGNHRLKMELKLTNIF